MPAIAPGAHAILEIFAPCIAPKISAAPFWMPVLVQFLTPTAECLLMLLRYGARIVQENLTTGKMDCGVGGVRCMFCLRRYIQIQAGNCDCSHPGTATSPDHGAGLVRFYCLRLHGNCQFLQTFLKHLWLNRQRHQEADNIVISATRQ